MKTVVNLKHGDMIDTLVVDNYNKDFLDYVHSHAERYKDLIEDDLDAYFSMIELDLFDDYNFELAYYYSFNIK